MSAIKVSTLFHFEKAHALYEYNAILQQHLPKQVILYSVRVVYF